MLIITQRWDYINNERRAEIKIAELLACYIVTSLKFVNSYPATWTKFDFFFLWVVFKVFLECLKRVSWQIITWKADKTIYTCSQVRSECQLAPHLKHSSDPQAQIKWIFSAVPSRNSSQSFPTHLRRFGDTNCLAYR